MCQMNRERAQMYSRAEYYAWAARRSSAPSGNDPISGRSFEGWRQLDKALGRASYAAMARVCFAAARTFPHPLERIA